MIHLDKVSARDKALLRLERELNRLHRVQGAAPVIPLERPFQRGWVKSFVLRRDVLRRPDAAAFVTALKAINQRVYCRDVAFLRPNGTPLLLRPRIIPDREWLKLAWPAKVQRLFAFGHWRLDEDLHQPLRWRRHVLGFKVASPWWLEENLQPHLITHQRVELPLVRKRIAEIESYLVKHEGWHRLHRLHGQRSWWRRESPPVHELRNATSHTDDDGAE